jgi:hypothetical protein
MLSALLPETIVGRGLLAAPPPPQPASRTRVLFRTGYSRRDQVDLRANRLSHLARETSARTPGTARPVAYTAAARLAPGLLSRCRSFCLRATVELSAVGLRVQPTYTTQASDRWTHAGTARNQASAVRALCLLSAPAAAPLMPAGPAARRQGSATSRGVQSAPAPMAIKLIGRSSQLLRFAG